MGMSARSVREHMLSIREGDGAFQHGTKFSCGSGSDGSKFDIR